ncbi:hypothetical protein ACFYZJ_25715 [Streptomyces sp. NPDC001848]|uniref:hypothetical protein n=1 Tax=Streptomyces sp. NPDC001848 TaxID=3364618 RepID=UPI0036C75817
MSRLSRGQQRGRHSAGAASGGGAGSGVTAIEVRVPAGTPDGVPAPGATVGGVPVVAGPGEPVQQAVLDHLHRLARATGHPVLASVHDERIGYVVPIRVHVDGSSEFAGEPVPRGAAPASAEDGGPTGTEPATRVLRVPSEAAAPSPSGRPASAPRSGPAESVTGAAPALRSGPAESVAGAGPGPQPMPAESVAGSSAPAPPGRAVATFALRAVPERVAFITATSGPAQALPGAPHHGGTPLPPAPPSPGTVSAPTGTFGPPPVMPPAPPATPGSSAAPERRTPAWPAAAPSSLPTPEVAAPPATDANLDPDAAPGREPASEPRTTPGREPASEPRTAPGREPASEPRTTPGREPAPEPRTTPVAAVEDDEVKEPPVREFDSVAEAVLGDPSAGGADGPAAEPMARISAAVKEGRIEEATGLAEQAVAESSAILGTDHPDVLYLRELTAYVAYLAADPLRSFHLSLDLARIRQRRGDARAAYGNVQSAAAAWRAVRDPLQGLLLGRDLIAVWSELAAAEGPAADDLDQLQKARSRMDRLAERARKASGERPAVQ